MNTEKEKQHYVPKFYLRNFSYQNNKKQIGVFNTKTNLFISQAKLKTQAYKPYYYGHDGELENLLAEIEGKFSPLVANIIMKKTLPQVNLEEHKLLLLFVILQELRNPATSNTIINNRKELIKRAKEFVSDDAAVDTEIPEMTKEDTVKMALAGIMTGLKYCNDLQIKLLINSTEVPFITSDNPVAKYNQYLEMRRWFGGWIGYASIGLQIFLPLNPEVTVVLYDGWTYRLGDKKKKTVHVTNEDVKQLNLLQILNCETNVFFNENATKQYLKLTHEKTTNHIKPHQPNSQVMGKVDALGKVDENSRIINLGTTNPRINLYLSALALRYKSNIFNWLSFCSLKYCN